MKSINRRGLSIISTCLTFICLEMVSVSYAGQLVPVEETVSFQYRGVSRCGQMNEDQKEAKNRCRQIMNEYNKVDQSSLEAIIISRDSRHWKEGNIFDKVRKCKGWGTVQCRFNVYQESDNGPVSEGSSKYSLVCIENSVLSNINYVFSWGGGSNPFTRASLSSGYKTSHSFEMENPPFCDDLVVKYGYGGKTYRYELTGNLSDSKDDCEKGYHYSFRLRNGQLLIKDDVDNVFLSTK